MEGREVDLEVIDATVRGPARAWSPRSTSAQRVVLADLSASHTEVLQLKKERKELKRELAWYRDSLTVIYEKRKIPVDSPYTHASESPSEDIEPLSLSHDVQWRAVVQQALQSIQEACEAYGELDAVVSRAVVEVRQALDGRCREGVFGASEESESWMLEEWLQDQLTLTATENHQLRAELEAAREETKRLIAQRIERAEHCASASDTERVSAQESTTHHLQLTREYHHRCCHELQRELDAANATIRALRAEAARRDVSNMQVESWQRCR